MAMESNSATAGSLTKPCKKCRVQEATLDSRGQPVCKDCFVKFIATKCVKQIGLLGRETMPPCIPNPSGRGPPIIQIRKYILGLSLGPSSTALLNLLHENIEYQLSMNRRTPFDLTVIHISSSLGQSSDPLTAHRKAYPRFTFLTIPLSFALTLPTIDWSSLSFTSFPPSSLSELFNSLASQSVASRTDIIHLLTRHLLLHQILTTESQALLLGHSTTSIAELTLTQTAKGRGFSLPWQINDGPFTIIDYTLTPTEEKKVLVYYPLRDVLRKELITYTTLTDPPLTELIPAEEKTVKENAAVVSHKDLSIEEVMLRYFADVEENYPSIVANVARTTGKLVRIGTEENEAGNLCGLCSMPMDGEGDERWRGELGTTDDKKGLGRLCYGCERSTLG
ncbi:hypothetical protein QBC38DRAFT_481429 [Podospora fimiseda]|uniref:Cytoplasmic tRNA 2-thiolation protein 2 n=1 Tax=Podospora fimiseda TaxID=252190 RepID=A0AAN7GW39_9PEZI|nr:hypothetical protein QBC38DRAFT_481429 [Podospora fimiseda]